MSLWTKLFVTKSHTPVVRSRLGLVRLDDRSLPSVTLPDGTVWVAPMLPLEQPASSTIPTPTVPDLEVRPGGMTNNPEPTIPVPTVTPGGGTNNPDTPKEITGVIGLDAESTSSAEKGKFTPRGGKERESTDEELEQRRPHYMQYDGPTEFKAGYTIGLKPDGSFDPSKSEITFTTVNYTSRSYVPTKSDLISAEDEAELKKEGKSVFRSRQNAYIFSKPKLEKDGWKTLSLPIAQATLKDGELQSFKFKADTWYGNPPGSIIDKGIVGEVDLAGGKTSFTAKYQSATTGVIATYVVEGKIKK